MAGGFSMPKKGEKYVQRNYSNYWHGSWYSSGFYFRKNQQMTGKLPANEIPVDLSRCTT